MRELLQLGNRALGIAKLIQAGQAEAARYNRLNLVFKISLETRNDYFHFISAIETFADNGEVEKLNIIGAHLISLATEK